MNIFIVLFRILFFSSENPYDSSNVCEIYFYIIHKIFALMFVCVISNLHFGGVIKEVC